MSPSEDAEEAWLSGNTVTIVTASTCYFILHGLALGIWGTRKRTCGFADSV